MLKKLRLQTKLFLYYSSIILTIIALALASFYFYLSSIFEQRAEENLTQLTVKTASQVDNYLMEMNRIALYVVSNPLITEVFSDIRKNISHANFFENDINETRRVQNTLVSISLPNNTSAMRTSLYNIKGDYISTGIPDSTYAINKRIESNGYSEWYGKLLAHNNKLLLPPHNDFWSDDKDSKLISLIREITDLSTSASYGIVEVQQPYNKLEDLIMPVSPSNTHTYLLSETGTVIYPLDESNKRQFPDIYLKRIGNKTMGNMKIKNPLTGKMELIAFNKSSFSGWTLIQSEEESSLLSPVKLTGAIILFTGLGLLLITLIVVYILTNQLTMPLKLLRNSVREVSLDNLSVDIRYSENGNEIVELNEAFDAMFTRLKESMSELMKARSHEIKAHMIALQSQMDPHFLYNMLSIINASSREVGASKITDICLKLSSMLRYISSYQEDLVPIRNEIDHVSNFLMLMKIRYEDQFSYEIVVDEKVNDLKIDIPKLTLQPLVENCFQHGFKNVLPPWYLAIRVVCDGNKWFVEISDNGKGMREEKINQLYSRVDDFIKNPSTNIKDLKIGGMGLINTLVRLKLLYKDDMILSIQSHIEDGTKITIGGNIH